jgi:hypothetical protein
MWGQAQHASLMLEVFRQGLLSLPLGQQDEVTKRAYADLLRRLLSSYLTMFFSPRLPPVLQPSSVQLRKYVLEQIKILFMLPPHPDRVQLQAQVCLEQVERLRHVIQNHMEAFEPEVRDALLYTLLDLTRETLVTAQQRLLAERLATPLCDAVLWAWLRARPQNERAWLTLQAGMLSLFHLPEPLQQVRQKLLALTAVLRDLTYPRRVDERLKYRRPADLLKGNANEEESAGERAAEEAFKRDPVAELTWDVDTIKTVWLKFLGIFKGVNKIADPQVHYQAIVALTEATNLLLQAERTTPVADLLPDSGAPRPLVLLNVVGPWLFEACQLTDIYLRGKAEAYAALCRLLLAPHPRPLPQRLLAHMYALLYQGLTEASSSLNQPLVSFAILEHAYSLYSVALPGATVLIPYFLAEIRRLLTRPDITPPVTVRRRAIQLLGSLVAYGGHFYELEVPCCPAYSSMASTALQLPAGPMRYHELPRTLFSLFSDILSNEPTPELRMHCLHALAVLAFEALLGTNGGPTAPGVRLLVSEICRTIFAQALQSDEAVALAALEALSALAHLHPLIHQMDEMLVPQLLEALCTHTCRLLQEASGGGGGTGTSPASSSAGSVLGGQRPSHRRTASIGGDTPPPPPPYRLIATHFYTLLDWLLLTPCHLFDAPSNFNQRLFETIDAALSFVPRERDRSGTGAEAGPTPGSARIRPDKVLPPVPKSKQATSPEEKEREKERDKKAAKKDGSGKEGEAGARPGRVEENPEEQVRDAARACLAQLANLLNRVPSRDGLEVVGSLVDEEDDRDPSERDLNTLFFLVDDSRIVSLVQVPCPGGGHMARIIIRDACSRFAWEGEPCFCMPPQAHTPTRLVQPCPAHLPRDKALAWLRSLPLASAQTPGTAPSPTAQAAQGVPPVRKSTSFSFRVSTLSFSQIGAPQTSAPSASKHQHSHSHTAAAAAAASAAVSASSSGSLQVPASSTSQGAPPQRKGSRATPRLSEQHMRIPSYRYSQLPNLDPGAGGAEPVDPITQLLRYLGDCHPDVLWPEERREVLDEPAAPLDEHLEAIQRMERSLLDQLIDDAKHVQRRREAYAQLEHLDLARPPDPNLTPASVFHLCRLLLAHMGLLSYERRRQVHLLRNDEKFYRSLLSLDRQSGREQAKVGLIYVAQGQDDQKQILRNERGSTLYHEFASGLGWVVDLERHRGYLGGLDRRGTTGRTSIYHASALHELMFHEIVAMPTSPDDDQQILKKRHVGNDNVHVVWNENIREYNPLTITSQFNDAHIVVNPLPNGLFRINVHRKEDRQRQVPFFGPLLDGMVLSKGALPILVRITALHANRAARSITEGWARPFIVRQRAIHELGQRFRMAKEWPELVHEAMHFKKQKKDFELLPSSPRAAAGDRPAAHRAVNEKLPESPPSSGPLGDTSAAAHEALKGSAH